MFLVCQYIMHATEVLLELTGYSGRESKPISKECLKAEMFRLRGCYLGQ